MASIIMRIRNSVTVEHKDQGTLKTVRDLVVFHRATYKNELTHSRHKLQLALSLPSKTILLKCLH